MQFFICFKCFSLSSLSIASQEQTGLSVNEQSQTLFIIKAKEKLLKLPTLILFWHVKTCVAALTYEIEIKTKLMVIHEALFIINFSTLLSYLTGVHLDNSHVKINSK